MKYKDELSQKITKKRNCCLFIERGLGATSITLKAITKLKESDEIKKVLIITSSSECKSVENSRWGKECRKNKGFNEIKLKIISESTEFRNNEKIEGDEIYIYIMDSKNTPRLLDCYSSTEYEKFDMIVIDEGSLFNDFESDEYRAVEQILMSAKRSVLINRNIYEEELYNIRSQVKLISKKIELEQNQEKFIKKYYYKHYQSTSNGKISDKFILKEYPKARKEVGKKIEDICVTLSISDYLSLKNNATY